MDVSDASFEPFMAVVSSLGLPGCDAVHCCAGIPAFQMSMLLPSPTTTLHDVTTRKTSTWMHLAQRREQWCALVNAVMNIRIL
jgi:hypothetical protein